jgi:hypothetical protein
MGSNYQNREAVILVLDVDTMRFEFILVFAQMVFLQSGGGVGTRNLLLRPLLHLCMRQRNLKLSMKL